MVKRCLGQSWLQTAARDRGSTPRPLLVVHLVANFDQAGKRLGPVDAFDGGWRDVLPTAHLVLCEQLSVAMRRPAQTIGCFWHSVRFSHASRHLSADYFPPVRSDVIVWGGDARGGRQRTGGEGAAG